MKWLGRRESDNVEDRRGMSGGTVAVGGGIIGIIIIVVKLFMGADPAQLASELQQQQQQTQQVQQDQPRSKEEEEMAKFVKVALADNEDVWHKIFQQHNGNYEEPHLVLFSNATESGCGSASASTGPFYCPGDQKVYIDLAFMDELKNRFGAKGGDFALAYVLAHEVGHHVQYLMGTSQKVHEKEEQLDKVEGNRYSVALELQADFYAGVWAHYEQQDKQALEEGDIEEALSAASAVGDDAIQKKIQGRVVPDAFTHGTSEQRIYWFTKGYKSGDISQGNTFAEMHLNL
ncbi:MAG: neutral zinc metallopeptidase [Chitinophagales bacterium]